jgi:hypothetical protein
VKQASEEATTLSWQGRRGPGDQQRQCMDKRVIKRRRIASVRIEGGRGWKAGVTRSVGSETPEANVYGGVQRIRKARPEKARPARR